MDGEILKMSYKLCKGCGKSEMVKACNDDGTFFCAPCYTKSLEEENVSLKSKLEAVSRRLEVSGVINKHLKNKLEADRNTFNEILLLPMDDDLIWRSREKCEEALKQIGEK